MIKWTNKLRLLRLLRLPFTIFTFIQTLSPIRRSTGTEYDSALRYNDTATIIL